MFDISKIEKTDVKRAKILLIFKKSIIMCINDWLNLPDMTASGTCPFSLLDEYSKNDALDKCGLICDTLFPDREDISNYAGTNYNYVGTNYIEVSLFRKCKSRLIGCPCGSNDIYKVREIASQFLDNIDSVLNGIINGDK